MKRGITLGIGAAMLSLSVVAQGTHPDAADAGNSALVARRCVVYRAQFWASTPALPQDIADAALSECGLQRAAAMSDARAVTGDDRELNRVADDELRRAAVAAVLQTRYSKK
jgi:hypothetical protein